MANWPWGLAVPLGGLLQGRWLLQSAPGSLQSWPPAHSSGVSEPAWPTGENRTGNRNTMARYMLSYRECVNKASPVPWPAFPSWWRCCHWSWGHGALDCVAWLKPTPSHPHSWYRSGACGLLPGCLSAYMEKQRGFGCLRGWHLKRQSSKT